MKLAVVGCREFVDFEKLSKILDAEHAKTPISVVVSGGAKGADSMAEEWAKSRGLETLIFLPEWKKYGRAAAIARNRQIIDSSEKCIAFWNDACRGTRSSIELAKKKGIPVEIIQVCL